HRTRADHAVPAEACPGQDDGVGADPAAVSDVHRGLGRPLVADGGVEVVVGVVLVGDVDVGAGVHVVADVDAVVGDDVGAAPDGAAVADTHVGRGPQVEAGHHPR